MRFCLVLLAAMILLPNIALADLALDKAVYMPGDTVNVTLSYPQKLGNFQLSVIGPDNAILARTTTMRNISSNVWTYNFNLAAKLANGKYTVNVNASKVDAIVNPNATVMKFNQSFNVSAWSVISSLDKYYLIQNERLNLTVMIDDKYSVKPTFYVYCTITDPSGKKVRISNFSISGVIKGFGDTYDINENYPLGVSSIFINVTDSEKRSVSKEVNFTVFKPVTFEPKEIEQTMNNEVLQSSVKFVNGMGAEMIVDSVEVSKEIRDIVTIVQRPYVIARAGTGTMEIRINAQDLSQNVYSGYISVRTSGVDSIIPIALNVVVPVKVEDTSYIIWCFAIGIVGAIAVITVVRYKTMKKKPKAAKEEPKKKVVYVQPQGDYRADYY